jgi:hypothetical protein
MRNKNTSVCSIINNFVINDGACRWTFGLSTLNLKLLHRTIQPALERMANGVTLAGIARGTPDHMDRPDNTPDHGQSLVSATTTSGALQ